MPHPRLYFPLLCLCFTTTLALAADAPPPSPAAAVVAKSPAADSAGEAALSAEIIKLGPAAVRDVCKMLVPLGSGDDTQVRDTLEGLRRYVTRPGAEDERKLYASALLDALADAKDVEVKTFLIERLKFSGKDECVPALAPLLAEPSLCEPATLTLLEIHTPAASAALAKALPSAQGGDRVTIIKALGTLRDESAAAQILKDATSEDLTLRLTALWALANLGEPSAAELLAKAADAKDPLERAKGVSFELLYATRQAEKGNKDSAAKLCRELIRTRTAAGESNVRSAALAVLVHAVGEAALGDLLEAADSPDAQFRNAALNLADAIRSPAVIGEWVKKLETVDPAVKVDLLNMLSRHKNPLLAAAAVHALHDSDPAVRRAAVAAAVAIDPDLAAEALVGVVRDGSPDEAKAAAEAMARVRSPVPLHLAADALHEASPAAKVLLLELLASRAAEGQANAVLAQAHDKEPAVRLAALKAMEKVATIGQERALIDYALRATDAAEEAAALRAVAGVVLKQADAEDRVRPIRAAIAAAQGAKRMALMQLLPRFGGDLALETARTDLHSADPALRQNAIRVLGDWPTLHAAFDLQQMIPFAPEGEAGLTQQVLAVRGLVQVLNRGKASAAEKATYYATVLPSLRRPEEKRQIIAELARERDGKALQVLAAALGDPATAADAAPAVAKMVLPAKEGDAGMGDPAAVAALGKAVPLLKEGKVRDQAEKYVSAHGKTP